MKKNTNTLLERLENGLSRCLVGVTWALILAFVWLLLEMARMGAQAQGSLTMSRSAGTEAGYGVYCYTIDQGGSGPIRYSSTNYGDFNAVLTVPNWQDYTGEPEVRFWERVNWSWGGTYVSGRRADYSMVSTNPPTSFSATYTTGWIGGWGYDPVSHSYTNTITLTNSSAMWLEYQLLLTDNPGETNEVTTTETFYLEPGQEVSVDVERENEFDWTVEEYVLDLTTDTGTSTNTVSTGSGVESGSDPAESSSYTYEDPNIYSNLSNNYGTQTNPSTTDGSRSTNGTNEFNQLITIESNNENRHDDLKALLVALDENERQRDELALQWQEANATRLLDRFGDGASGDQSSLGETNAWGADGIGTRGTVGATNGVDTIYGSTNQFSIPSGVAPSYTIPLGDLHESMSDWDFDLGDSNLDPVVGYSRPLLLYVVVLPGFFWAMIRLIGRISNV
jgi:hypothetical protein